MDKFYKGKYFTFIFATPKEELDKKFTAMVQEFYDHYYKVTQTD